MMRHLAVAPRALAAAPGALARAPRPWLPPPWMAALAVYLGWLWLLPARQAFVQLWHHPEVADFQVFWLASRVGLRHGWAAMYDPHVFGAAYAAATGGRFMPFVNPPPLAWLVLPLGALPYPPALWLWRGLVAAALVGAWWWCAPAGGAWARAAWLGLLAGIPGVIENVTLGQSTWLVVAGVAACWWLLRVGREGLAGLALAVTLLKPQLAWLVPAALLAAGYRRAAAGWLAGAVALGAASLAALGPSGLRRLVGAVQSVHRLPDLKPVTPYALLHGGTAGLLAAAACGALGLVAARRLRGAGPGPLLAAGVLASFLAAPYANAYDVVLLVLAAWLALEGVRLRPAVLLYLACAWAALVLVNVTTWPEVLAAAAGLLLLAASTAAAGEARRVGCGSGSGDPAPAR